MRAPLEFGYLLMELTDRATRALETGDFPRAVRYFEAVVVAAPERSVGYAKLCQSYAGMNDRARALDACRKSLGAEGVQVADYSRFVALLLKDQKQLGAAELAEMDAIFTHLREEKVDSLAMYELECEVGPIPAAGRQGAGKGSPRARA
jgi:predicted Zn-dependent protease